MDSSEWLREEENKQGRERVTNDLVRGVRERLRPRRRRSLSVPLTDEPVSGHEGTASSPEETLPERSPYGRPRPRERGNGFVLGGGAL